MPVISNEDEMVPNLKEKWIEALRSGEYKQGQGSLAMLYDKADGDMLNGVHYCCLGVLCEVAQVDYEIDAGLPDAHFLKSIGLNYSFATSLASMNDQGKNFVEIARAIEENA